jgi:hypothetical protein
VRTSNDDVPCVSGKCSRVLIRRESAVRPSNEREFVSENLKSCYSLRSTSDDENPPWPCSPRNPAAACRARRRRAEASNARERLSPTPEAARPSSLGVGRRTAARGLPNARLRERDAAVRASGFWRPLGGSETFPPCKPLKTKETELESRQIILPRSEQADAMAATVSPNRKESRRRVDRRRRSREIGGSTDAGRRNFPIRKSLKRLKAAKESRWLSGFVPARVGVQGEGRVRFRRFRSSRSAEAGLNSQ